MFRALPGILLVSLVCILLFSAIPQVYATTENRYFKNAKHTVNGLNTWQFATDQTGTSYTESESRSTYYTGCNVGIRVWVRHADGTETEITSGTPVAQVSVAAGESHVLKSAMWNCPQTSLASTDAIVVRVYHDMGGWDLIGTATFITEQLGASQLDASTWTVYYYLGLSSQIFPRPRSSVAFHFDGSDNSRIEGFSYTVGAAKEWHDIATWTFNLTARKWFDIASWNFNVSTLQWNNISVWNFNLTTGAWYDIATWSFNLLTKAWSNLAQWTFQLAARTWRNIAEWSFNLVTLGWHTISYWILTVSTTNIPILFIGIIFTACILFLVIGLALKKRS